MNKCISKIILFIKIQRDEMAYDTKQQAAKRFYNILKIKSIYNIMFTIAVSIQIYKLIRREI